MLAGFGGFIFVLFGWFAFDSYITMVLAKTKSLKSRRLIMFLVDVLISAIGAGLAFGHVKL